MRERREVLTPGALGWVKGCRQAALDRAAAVATGLHYRLERILPLA